jgi:radical SAM protein with 4Fe4S-binding SPASM domain
MLNLMQLLIFELGRECNLSERHKNVCPITYMPRGKEQLTDDVIIKTVGEAYNSLMFTGFIGWHFYNEPMLYNERMLSLMVRIRQQIPQSRFLLWTNGTILIKDSRMALFECTFISNYFKKDPNEFVGYFNNIMINEGGETLLDNRIQHFMVNGNNNSCGVPFESFLIGNDGTTYMCCHDWRNDIKIGNILFTGLSDLASKKWEYVKEISGKQMTGNAPETCLRCNAKYSGIADFDLNISNKAKVEIGKL